MQGRSYTMEDPTPVLWQAYVFGKHRGFSTALRIISFHKISGRVPPYVYILLCYPLPTFSSLEHSEASDPLLPQA